MEHTLSQIEPDGNVAARPALGEHTSLDDVIALFVSSQSPTTIDSTRRQEHTNLDILEESMPEQERNFLMNVIQQIAEAEPSKMDLEEKIAAAKAELERQNELHRQAESIRQAEREEAEIKRQILEEQITTQTREFMTAQKWHQQTCAQLDKLLHDHARAEHEIQTLHNLAEGQQDRVLEASYRLAASGNVTRELQQRIAEKDRLIDGLRALLVQRDSEIAALRLEKESQLQRFPSQLENSTPNVGHENAQGSLPYFPPSNFVTNMNVDAAQPGTQPDTAGQPQPMLCEDSTFEALRREFMLSPSDWFEELPLEQPEGARSLGERLSINGCLPPPQTERGDMPFFPN